MPAPPPDTLVPAAREAADKIERIAFSPAEAAAALGCSRQHVHNMLRRGDLRAVKLGRSTRISAAELHRVLGDGVTT